MRATETGSAGTAAASAGRAPPTDGDGRFSVLSWEQVQRLDHILEEAVPIHGRGNFPTLSVRPRRIVQVREGARGGPRLRSRWEDLGVTSGPSLRLGVSGTGAAPSGVRAERGRGAGSAGRLSGRKMCQ